MKNDLRVRGLVLNDDVINEAQNSNEINGERLLEVHDRFHCF